MATYPTSGDDDIVGDSRDDNIASNGGNDVIHGLAGNDSLFGGSGSDRLWGGEGDDYLRGGKEEHMTEPDFLYGESGNDTLLGGPGDDFLDGGSGKDKLYGDAGNDKLYGRDGDDELRGGTGADTMSGGYGNDRYWVDNVGDRVVESGSGVDTVYASISYTLGGSVENLSLTGTAMRGTGNGLNNTIDGNASNNTLRGEGGVDTLNGNAGSDTLFGGSGNDALRGGSGNDVLRGETGNDRLTGGAGTDKFVFSHRGGAHVDTLLDFSHVDDTIVLTNSLDAGLANMPSPGIAGLHFRSGNVSGSQLDSEFFFKGNGFAGNGDDDESGIYVNSLNGQIWYNPTTDDGGDSMLLGTVSPSAASTMTTTDFEYGV